MVMFHSYIKLPEGNLSPLIFSPYRPLWSQICVDKNPTKSMVFEVFCSTGRGKMEDWLIIAGRWVKHLAPQQRTVSWLISKTLAPKQNIALDKCSDAQTLRHVDHSWWTSKDIKHLQKGISGTLTVIYIYVCVYSIYLVFTNYGPSWRLDPGNIHLLRGISADALGAWGRSVESFKKIRKEMGISRASPMNNWILTSFDMITNMTNMTFNGQIKIDRVFFSSMFHRFFPRSNPSRAMLSIHHRKHEHNTNTLNNDRPLLEPDKFKKLITKSYQPYSGK